DGRYHIRFDETIRSGGPCFRISDQREADGTRNRARREFLICPTATERSPGFQIDVAEIPFRKLFLRPFRSGFDLRRSGEAPAEYVGEIAEGFHDLRTVEAFILDPVYRIEVRLFRRHLRD